VEMLEARRRGCRLELPWHWLRAFQKLREMLLGDPNDAATVADAVMLQLPRGDKAVDRRHRYLESCRGLLDRHASPFLSRRDLHSGVPGSDG
jgi:hypothetical protein